MRTPQNGISTVVTCVEGKKPNAAEGDIWLGIIDYRTLSAAQAIINIKEKTITFFVNE